LTAFNEVWSIDKDLIQFLILKCVIRLHGPSVLWRCWLGVRNLGHPARENVTDEVLAWLSTGARCKQLSYGLADATATHIVSASAKSRMVYPSGTGLPRLSWKKAVKRLCVCVCFISDSLWLDYYVFLFIDWWLIVLLIYSSARYCSSTKCSWCCQTWKCSGTWNYGQKWCKRQWAWYNERAFHSVTLGVPCWFIRGYTITFL